MLDPAAGAAPCGAVLGAADAGGADVADVAGTDVGVDVLLVSATAGDGAPDSAGDPAGDVCVLHAPQSSARGSASPRAVRRITTSRSP
ncbi:MAG: hypothetical protein NVSMB55_28700 [Mycobacteriales bacterium]